MSETWDFRSNHGYDMDSKKGAKTMSQTDDEFTENIRRCLYDQYPPRMITDVECKRLLSLLDSAQTEIESQKHCYKLLGEHSEMQGKALDVAERALDEIGKEHAGPRFGRKQKLERISKIVAEALTLIREMRKGV